MDNRLLDLYQRLFAHFGPQHWWPGDTPLEIIIGAVLTQNTNWVNVSKAIENLKTRAAIDFSTLDTLPLDMLAELIRPSGYYNLKAKRLKNLFAFIRHQCQGDLEYFFNQETSALRDQLLSIKGIGPETADSILLYAAGKTVFVVDAYTHRILSRHGLASEDEADYHDIQNLFESELPHDLQLFNEYHALLVRTGKEYCKKTKPRCESCPLNGFE